MDGFLAEIEREGRAAGVPLRRDGDPVVTTDNALKLHSILKKFLSKDVRIVLVMLLSGSYGAVK